VKESTDTKNFLLRRRTFKLFKCALVFKYIQMFVSPLLKYLHTCQFYFIQKLHALSPESITRTAREILATRDSHKIKCEQ